MADYQATPEQWNTVQRCADVVGSADCSAVLELRARVETLEAAAQKHIVETSANILALASRVEALEAAKQPEPKVYEINKPLKLTSKQQEQLNALLRPNSKPTPNPSQIRSSLVERVANAIESEAGSKFATVEARAAIRDELLAIAAELDLSTTETND